MRHSRRPSFTEGTRVWSWMVLKTQPNILAACRSLPCLAKFALLKGNLIFSKSEGAFVSTKQRFSFASCKLQVIFKGPIYRASPSDAPKNHVLRFISGHVDHDQPARSLLWRRLHQGCTCSGTCCSAQSSPGPESAFKNHERCMVRKMLTGEFGQSQFAKYDLKIEAWNITLI